MGDASAAGGINGKVRLNGTETHTVPGLLTYGAVLIKADTMMFCFGTSLRNFGEFYAL